MRAHPQLCLEFPHILYPAAHTGDTDGPVGPSGRKSPPKVSQNSLNSSRSPWGSSFHPAPASSIPYRELPDVCRSKTIPDSRTALQALPWSHDPAHTECRDHPSSTKRISLIPRSSRDPHGCLQLTSAGGFLGQLQAVDGEPVDPAARVAPLSLAFHVALGFAGVGCLDLVPAVALGPEFQPRVQVPPAERETGSEHIPGISAHPRDPPGSRGFGRNIPAHGRCWDQHCMPGIRFWGSDH